MSRRISFFVLAASAALIASPASADRECFENSCRLPGVIEPPPQVEPAREPEANAEPRKPDELNAEQPAAQARVLRQSLPPAPPVAQARTLRQPAPLPAAIAETRQERDTDDAAAEVSRVVPKSHARTERVAVYGMSHAAASGGAIVEVPGAVYSPAPAPFYPYAQPDPAWRSCQSEQQRGTVYCGPTSYHPYGAYGYRPNGTYAGYRSPPIYAVAPNAKIITIETSD
jgi:hypothetical protein